MHNVPDNKFWQDIVQVKPGQNQVIKQKASTNASTVLANRLIGNGHLSMQNNPNSF